jgi:hypothetical protein
VIDHVLVDVITAIRRSFDDALLQRQAVEERFQVDVFLGDVAWETSYCLPGEEQPPRVRADLSVDWPTWSQTAYRSWSIGEEPDEMPEVVVEVALRIQRLAGAPDPAAVLAVFPAESPPLAGEALLRTSITSECLHAVEGAGTPAAGAARAGGPPVGAPGEPPAAAPGGDPDGAAGRDRWALEATYEGSIRFTEANLDDPSTLGPTVDALTRWVSSTLVQLADLPFTFLPPDPEIDD